MSRSLPRTQGICMRYWESEEWPKSSLVHQGHHSSVSRFPVASCLPRGNTMRCLMASAQRCHPFLQGSQNLGKDLKVGPKTRAIRDMPAFLKIAREGGLQGGFSEDTFGPLASLFLSLCTTTSNLTTERPSVTYFGTQAGKNSALANH